MKIVITLYGPRGDIVKKINVKLEEATPGALEGLGVEELHQIVDLGAIHLVSSVNIEGKNE